MIVSYSSNNSGGSWWLDDNQWRKLEEAGWRVEWGDPKYCHSRYNPKEPPIHESSNECDGHFPAASYAEAKKLEKQETKIRWLGALAKGASKEVESVREAIEDFERVTGLTASDEGCNCCGPPHSFSWPGGGYASGESILDLLFDEQPERLRSMSRREMLEELRRQDAEQREETPPPARRKIVLSRGKKRK